MNGVETLLDDVRKRGIADGHFRGLLNVLVGRRITGPDGAVISSGQTWRAMAELLKRLRWQPEAVREIGLDPDTLAPRDRQRFWFSAITAAQVQSAEAAAAGDAFADRLAAFGYAVGPAPRGDAAPGEPR